MRILSGVGVMAVCKLIGVNTGEIVTGTRDGVGSRVFVGGSGVLVDVAVAAPGSVVCVFSTIGKNGS